MFGEVGRHARYSLTDKGKARNARYEATEKARFRKRRWIRKRRNAEDAAKLKDLQEVLSSATKAR